MCEWTFKGGKISGNLSLDAEATTVIFHPTYSNGTAVICGQKPLRKGYHHYWEFHLPNHVYGSSFMVGIGTEKMDLSIHQHNFHHLLGTDKESWGGKVFHDGKAKCYATKRRWDQGMTVGVYLDMHCGTMEFFLNKEPLGVAFTGIPTSACIYPMVSSTAAKSAITLVSSASYQHGLKFLSIRAIGDHLRKTRSDLKDLCLPPGLFHFVANNFVELIIPVKRVDVKDGAEGRHMTSDKWVIADSESEEEEEATTSRRLLRPRPSRRQVDEERMQSSSSEDDVSQLFSASKSSPELKRNRTRPKFACSPDSLFYDSD